MPVPETSYEIIISLKAISGWTSFGYFQLGDRKEQAVSTFESLSGQAHSHDVALRMELFENVPEGNVMLLQKTCNLNELAENVRVITRDAFKYVNLE